MQEQQEAMYRIVFYSVTSDRSGLVVEKGPMHPSKEIALQWVAYFEKLGYQAHMKVEQV